MSLAFHACPPPGQWINDPNALFVADGAYRLLVQHRSDAPEFRATGWARFSSCDLLRWTFDGPVIPAGERDWSYSGSVLLGAQETSAFHTVHEAGLECQVVRTTTDGGAHWTEAVPLPSLGEPAPNRRDPYVFAYGDEWRLLLAEPCDWAEWPSQPSSRIAVYRSADLRHWTRVGTIGPFCPPGVMWEVPLLVSVDGYDLLLVSTIDRRTGSADCSVFGWPGAFDGADFQPHPGAPAEGQLIDLGPDFYAMMGSRNRACLDDKPAFVGWAASWATARTMTWPGFSGGPISLPRELSVVTGRGGEPRVQVAIAAAVLGAPWQAVPTRPRAGFGTAVLGGEDPFQILLSTSASRFTLTADPLQGRVTLVRDGTEDLAWTRSRRIDWAPRSTRGFMIFIDGPLAEIFLPQDGDAISVALGADLERVDLFEGSRQVALEWNRLPAYLPPANDQGS